MVFFVRLYFFMIEVNYFVCTVYRLVNYFDFVDYVVNINMLSIIEVHPQGSRLLSG